jgi:hypothetical protein
MKRPEWTRSVNYDLRSLVIRFIATSLPMAAIAFGIFADSPLPASYVVRPLVAIGIAALLVALVTGLLPGAKGVILAVALGFATADTVTGLVLGAAIGIAAIVLRRSGPDARVAGAALFFAGVLFITNGIRALPNLELEPASNVAYATPGRAIYLILVDGYPRADTLQALGIDISAFVATLEARGFEHYPEATAVHGWTHLTLTALFTGRIEPDERGNTVARRQLRQTWSLPPGWVAVSPPLGHVTIPRVPTIGPSGMNNYEARLIGRSILGWLPIGESLVMDGLRDRLESSINAVAAAGDRRVFAHLMAPHPPFLYGPGGSAGAAPECWPGCQIFATQIEELRISRASWVARESVHLAHINELLIQMVDRILVESPDASIVLFSDHGGRYSAQESDEWHRTFLIARTPGHSRLFGPYPEVGNLLRELEAAY